MTRYAHLFLQVLRRPWYFLWPSIWHTRKTGGAGSRGTGTKEFPVWRLRQSFNYGSFPIGAKGPLKAKLSQDFYDSKGYYAKYWDT